MVHLGLQARKLPGTFEVVDERAAAATTATDAGAAEAAGAAEGERLLHNAVDWNSHFLLNFQNIQKPELDQCLKIVTLITMTLKFLVFFSQLFQ